MGGGGRLVTVILTWLFGHVLVELSPILILILVLGIRKPPEDGGESLSTAELLFGDGILFFFSLVLSVGLFTDLLMDLLGRTHRLQLYQFVQFLMLILIFTVGCWTGYVFTQIRRFDKQKTKIWWSVAATIMVISFVGWIRLTFGIW